MSNVKSYYYDMDGVLVQYDKNAYIGDNPLYLQKHQHYFRNLKPDIKLLKVFDLMKAEAKYNGNKLYIITSISNQNGAIFNEHLHDKIEWLHEWIPALNIQDIFISVTSKRDVGEFINGRNLTSYDVLIDDYNKNLIDWQKAGGTSVKYGNGLNDITSFDGIALPESYDAEQIMNVLDNIELKF